MGVESEPLDFVLIVICELWPTHSFNFPFSDCSFVNGRIDPWKNWWIIKCKKKQVWSCAK